jgi:hypothetical protein
MIRSMVCQNMRPTVVETEIPARWFAAVDSSVPFTAHFCC